MRADNGNRVRSSLTAPSALRRRPRTFGSLSAKNRVQPRRDANRTLLVVPCHNEALRLDTAVLRRQLERHADRDWLLVDDGSNDTTALLLDELAREYPRRVTVLHLPHNMGKAEAIRQGLLAALDQQPLPRYIGYWDADFAAPLDTIEPFRELLERRPELQGVLGVRMGLGGHKIKRELHKSFFNRALSWLASGVLGVRFRDPTCGAKLFRVTPQFQSALHRPFATRGIFDIELIARLANYYERAGMGPVDWTLYEYPLDSWNDVGGSHRRLDDYWDAFWDLGRIYWERTWQASPSRGDFVYQTEFVDEPQVEQIERPTVENETTTENGKAPTYSTDELLKSEEFSQALAELEPLDEVAELDGVLKQTPDWTEDTAPSLQELTAEELDALADADALDWESDAPRRKAERAYAAEEFDDQTDEDVIDDDFMGESESSDDSQTKNHRRNDTGHDPNRLESRRDRKRRKRK